MLALKNSPFIIIELQRDEKLLEIFSQIIKKTEASINDNNHLTDDFFDGIEIVLDRFSKSNFQSLKLESKKLKPIVKELRGKNLNEVLLHLSLCKPTGRFS